MGIHIIKTPDIGEGIAEVELVAWHVQVGDSVAQDQTLADVMTDKATVEIPSPVAGTVLALGAGVGQAVAVGSELIRLEVADSGNLPTDPVSRPPPVPVSAPVPVSVSAPVPVPALAPIVAAGQSPVLAAVSLPPPVAAPVPAAAAGPGRVDASVTAATEAGLAADSVPPIAAPAVRRRAWELGIDLAQVQPSGTAGRIRQADLDAYAAHHQNRPSATPTPSQPAANASPSRLPAPPALLQGATPASSVPAGQAPDDGQQTLAVIGLRRKIALKMQESKRRIPHFTYVEEVDVTELEALRTHLNAQYGAQRSRLTLLPLLVRALVLALREFPQMNARFDDDKGLVTRFAALHLGLATQTDNGLMVPVLRHAQTLDLWTCAAAIAQLAQATRAGRVTRADLSGSTLTITSLGALGGIVTTPVINHPEVAIIGINRIVARPVLHRGAIVVRQMMNLSSSFDHRVIDGLDAARFVQALRSTLELPATLFVG